MNRIEVVTRRTFLGSVFSGRRVRACGARFCRSKAGSAALELITPRGIRASISESRPTAQ